MDETSCNTEVCKTIFFAPNINAKDPFNIERYVEKSIFYKGILKNVNLEQLIPKDLLFSSLVNYLTTENNRIFNYLPLLRAIENTKIVVGGKTTDQSGVAKLYEQKCGSNEPVRAYLTNDEKSNGYQCESLADIYREAWLRSDNSDFRKLCHNHLNRIFGKLTSYRGEGISGIVETGRSGCHGRPGDSNDRVDKHEDECEKDNIHKVAKTINTELGKAPAELVKIVVTFLQYLAEPEGMPFDLRNRLLEYLETHWFAFYCDGKVNPASLEYIPGERHTDKIHHIVEYMKGRPSFLHRIEHCGASAMISNIIRKFRLKKDEKKGQELVEHIDEHNKHISQTETGGIPPELFRELNHDCQNAIIKKPFAVVCENIDKKRLADAHVVGGSPAKQTKRMETEQSESTCTSRKRKENGREKGKAVRESILFKARTSKIK